MNRFPSREAAIVGIGATEFSKDSGRSELTLALECILSALHDAGLTASDVDGLSTFTMDTNSEEVIARNLGLPGLNFFSRIHFGGGAAAAPFQQAILAVTSGVAECVVVYRAFNERSGVRFGQGPPPGKARATTENEYRSWVNPYGLLTPAQHVAMAARRYLHASGATSEDFGRVAVLARKHAATNPRAWFHGRPLTLAEHQESRWIVEPLHLYDCCQETDGGQALVVVSAERARDLPNPPAYLAAAAQSIGPDQHNMTSYYREDLARVPELARCAEQLWRQSGLGPDAMDAAVLYDHFTPYVLNQLEEYGFCEPGEARHFVADGHLEVDGRLPTNTHGGQIGEGYLHGVNGVAEGVRLIRGSSVNQPAKQIRHALVTGGVGVPTSALVLAADPG
ncbi:lipid-transfer protein [Enemella dayhoffiae]|uniref:Lipid-transfer protein n=1 Tax=Enemella dayhoffiae TaxID=2016507 RepID=A0A255GL68_9ACTN|nr:lipid-transfer protein [Enemella dayhoffiae]OYO16559.1 lipid-transfer protein [Enemella dayhoffiae]